MVSQEPMILMGDEIGRTQQGNNNAYCHDNDLSWMDWTLLKSNGDLFRFFKLCIAFARRTSCCETGLTCGMRITWEVAILTLAGMEFGPGNQTGRDSRVLAFMLCGKHANNGQSQDNQVYVAMNMHWESHRFELPELPPIMQWHVFANTSAPSPEDIWDPGASRCRGPAALPGGAAFCRNSWANSTSYATKRRE